MRVVKCYSSSAKAWIEKQIQRLPSPLRELLADVRIYCFRSDASVDGTVPRNRRTTDGRPSCHTSHFNEELNAIVLFAKDVDTEDGAFNMFLHEVGHALDWHLGFKRYHISEYIDCGDPLDDHAALSPREQFAQAFEAWFRWQKRPASTSHEHTRDELLQKAPRLYSFLKLLLDASDDEETPGNLQS